MMNRRTFLSVTLFHFSAAALFFGASLPTQAQGPGGLFGGQIGEMIGKMRQSRAFADPGISNTSNLLTRSDVTNELVLNGRQTEALAELQSGYPAAMMQQMQTTFTKIFQDQGAVNFQEMSAEERQDFGLKMRDKAQEAMFTVQAEQDKKSEVGLAPSQLKRLHELDLQWRGPLALTDAKVNEKFSLTADQVARLSVILKEFHQAQEDARMAMFGGRNGQQRPGPGGIAAGQPAAGGVNPATGTPLAKGANPPAAGTTPPAAGANPPGGGFGNFRMPSSEELQTQMIEADKQILKLRKTTDVKVLALLTPTQLQMWKTAQGKTFAFRINL